MKKIGFTFLLLVTIVCCNEKEEDPFAKLQELEDNARQSKYRSDSTLLGFTLGQTPLSFKSHIEMLLQTNVLYTDSSDGKYKFLFQTNDENLKVIPCRIDVNFLNDRLNEFALYSDFVQNNNSDIKNLAKKKLIALYGDPDVSIENGNNSTNDFWFHNNQRIVVKQVKAGFHLVYTDMHYTDVQEP
ncbi:MAG: hypothetical protein ACTHMM_05655 [Agriterribacter sp.]